MWTHMGDSSLSETQRWQEVDEPREGNTLATHTTPRAITVTYDALSQPVIASDTVPFQQ